LRSGVEFSDECVVKLLLHVLYELLVVGRSITEHMLDRGEI